MKLQNWSHSIVLVLLFLQSSFILDLCSFGELPAFVPAHSVSFRVLQIGQNHFSSHIFINFCLSPQSSVLITIIECNVQAVFHSFLRIQHYTLSWRYYIFLQGWNLLYAELMKIGILLPKLFWLTVRKNCSSDQEQLLKFEAEGREFSIFLRSVEQLNLFLRSNKLEQL